MTPDFEVVHSSYSGIPDFQTPAYVAVVFVAVDFVEVRRSLA